MVVRALAAIALVGAVLLTLPSWGQGGTLRSWVTSTEVIQDRPFWLFVEASGESIDLPQITQGEGLVITPPRIHLISTAHLALVRLGCLRPILVCH